MKRLLLKAWPARAVRYLVEGLLILALPVSAAAAQAQNEGEALVLRQAALGKEADLSALPAEKKTLRAEFLVPLLLGRLPGASVSHEGVMIKGARIEGWLGLAGAEIPFATWFTNCEFTAGADLSSSHWRGDLSLSGSTFRGDADLDGLRADGNVILEMANFAGVFDVSDAKISGNLEASGATFLAPQGNQENHSARLAQFDNVKVASRADLDHLTLEVALTLDGAEAQIITLGKVKSPRPPSNLEEKPGLYSAKTIILTDATVHRDLQIIGVSMDCLLANGLKVEGATTLENVVITGLANFSHAQLFSLVLSGDTVWPGEKALLQLEGISFQYISPFPQSGETETAGSNDEQQWTKLTKWANQASFRTAPYQQLEDVLKKQGRGEQADDVYKNMQRRMLIEGGLSWVGKCKNVLLYLLVGYGREPNWAFYWCLAVIMIGRIVFRSEKKVQPKDPKAPHRTFDPLWYSIDLFLPLSGLQAADVWIPRQDSLALRYYAGIHSILGWILVPIGLAAVSGLISGK